MDAQLRLIHRPTTPDQAHRTEVPAAARSSRRGPATTAEPTEAPRQWRIDDSARERGRAGISRAREALRNARRPLPSERHSTAA